MIAVDVSLLAWAINRFPPEHARAARVLEDLVNGEWPWAIPSPVVPEFVRAVTHPHAVARPLAPEEALTFVEELLGAPSAHLLAPGAGHVAALREVSAAAPANIGGTRLALAAVLREHGVREILTVDRVLSRLPFLSAIDPVHGPAWTPEGRPQRRYRVLGSRRRG